MTKCRLYIADVDMRFVASVRDLVVMSPNIELVGNSGNGRVALGEILRLSPDVVLTDIPLPELDGISLLRETRRIPRPPAVIVCTCFYSLASMNCACRYGAAFFMCKPVDLQSLPSLILECGKCAERNSSTPKSEERTDAELRRSAAARDLIKRLGLSPRLDGAAYILEAVLYCRDETLLKNLSRGLYTDLARRMNTTPTRVERSLRSAIQIAYDRGTLAERFSHRPTNLEFITYMMREVDKAERGEGR